MPNPDKPQTADSGRLPDATCSLPPDKCPHCGAEKAYVFGDAGQDQGYACAAAWYRHNNKFHRSDTCREREIGRLREALGMCESAMIGHVIPKHPAWKALDAIKAENAAAQPTLTTTSTTE